MAGGGAALSRVSSRGRLAAPYPTVPYSTVPYCVLPCSRNIRQSISYPVSLKESQGERKPLLETGENVENSVENLLQGAQAAAGTGTGAAEHGAVPTGGTCGCGRGFWSGTVRRGLSAGAGVVDAFGWRVVAAVRCGTRVQRRARWLAFFQREKMLDKLCKSILNWKQGITQAAARDGLRHRPHRRSCPYIPHVHLIRRGDFGHALRVRRAPFRRCPPQNGDEKLRPASNRCWAEFCDSSRAGAAAFSLAILRGGLFAGFPAAFPQPFLCACGHRAAFLTRPSRSCPRATPRTGCAYGRSGGRTPSSPATTTGRTR